MRSTLPGIPTTTSAAATTPTRASDATERRLRQQLQGGTVRRRRGGSDSGEQSQDRRTPRDQPRRPPRRRRPPRAGQLAPRRVDGSRSTPVHARPPRGRSRERRPARGRRLGVGPARRNVVVSPIHTKRSTSPGEPLACEYRSRAKANHHPRYSTPSGAVWNTAARHPRRTSVERPTTRIIVTATPEHSMPSESGHRGPPRRADRSGRRGRRGCRCVSPRRAPRPTSSGMPTGCPGSPAP